MPQTVSSLRRDAAVRRSVILLAALAFAAPAPGTPDNLKDPEYLVSNWQTTHGLPENSATAMVQTPDGYLWLGTFNGLVRFDGLKFVVFNFRNMPALPNLNVVNLHLDRAGGFWVSTVGGTIRSEGGSWRRFESADGWRGNFVRFFADGPDGAVYITTFDRHLLRYANGRFTELPHAPGRVDRQFPFVDLQGGVHAANRDYLNTWNGNGWDSTPLPDEIRTAGALMFGAARDGRLWAVSGRSLWKLEGTQAVKRVALDTSIEAPWSLTEDRSGEVWVCSYRAGLYRISPNGRVRVFNPGAGFPSNDSRFVFTDRQGSHWVGTSGGGLVRLRERRILAVGPEHGLPPFPVKAVAAEPDGSMLVATYGKGTYRFRDGKFVALPLGSPDAFAQTLLVDRQGRIWVGTYGDGLTYLERGKTTAVPTEVTGRNVTSLYEDSRGRVWVAGNTHVVSASGASFERYEVAEPVPGVPVRCFAEERESGQVWAGGDGGLLRLEGSRFVPVKDSTGSALPPVNYIHPAGSGTLWLGIATEGLLLWRNGVVSALGSGEVSLGTVGGILEEGGFFWLATNRGVWRFRRQDLEKAVHGRAERLEWQRFDGDDGLPSAECTWDHQPSVGRDGAGRLWFSTLKGAAVIDPKRLALDTTEVEVKVEEVSYLTAGGDEVSLGTQALAPGRVRVPAGGHNLRITYTALEFARPEKLLFSYELRDGGGVVTVGERPERELYFPRLDHGSYILAIRARNADGLWGRTPKKFEFFVEPRIWERISFQLLLGSLMATCLAWAALSIGRSHSLRAMERLAQQKEKAELQARLLQAGKMESIGRLAGGVAHGFNNLLTVINGYSQLVLAKMDDRDPLRDSIEQVLKAGERAAGLTRQLLAFSRKQVLQPRALDLNGIVTDMQPMLTRLVGPASEIRLALSTTPVPVLADPLQLEQVILNLALNARDAMPTGGRMLIETACVERSAEYTRTHPDAHAGRHAMLAVSDTGVGMDEATRQRVFEPFFTTKPVGQGIGLGLATVQGIVAQSGGDIEVESEPGHGTTFRVYLPAHS